MQKQYPDLTKMHQGNRTAGMLAHVGVCTARVCAVMLNQRLLHGRGKWKAQHRDPQTLNGVGVKGLVGERRRKSLL